jgi:uncharacterized protein YkwD
MKKLLPIFALILLLPSISYAAISPAELINLANQDRAAFYLPPLIENPILTKAAQKRADYLALTGYFSHQDLQGNWPWHYFTENGYIFTYAGENLARYFTDSESTEKGFMNSPTHKANILNIYFKEVGSAISIDSQGKYYVVEFYGTRK